MKIKWWYFPVALGAVFILIYGGLTCVIRVKVGAHIASIACDRRADSYYDNGEYEEAVKWSDRALKLDPRSGWNYYRKARALAELGRLEEAVEVYDEALARYAGDDFIYLVYDGKAEALAELGKWEEAVETYGHAIDHSPNSLVVDPLFDGKICFERKSYAKAIAHFEAAAETDADNYELYQRIGLSWLALGRYENAASDFDVVIKLAPDYAPARERKALALGLLGRYEAAIACADGALVLDADDPDAWNTKGKILLYSGDAGGARKCFGRAAAPYPPSPGSLLATGMTYFAEAAYDEARPYFEELVVDEGGSAHYLLYLYLVDRAEGRPGTDRLQPLLETTADPWLKKIRLFLVGRISADDLIVGAEGDRILLCGAHFFIAYKNKLDGDAAAARRHFREAVAAGRHEQAEYSLARYELARSGDTRE